MAESTGEFCIFRLQIRSFEIATRGAGQDFSSIFGFIKPRFPRLLRVDGELDVPGRIRTSDLLIRSQPLYPAELRALLLDAFSKGPTNITEIWRARQGETGNDFFRRRSRFDRWLLRACFLRFSLVADD